MPPEMSVDELIVAGDDARREGDVKLALRLLRAAAEEARRMGDRRLAGHALASLAVAQREDGDLGAAERSASGAIQEFRATGAIGHELAWALRIAAQIALGRGDGAEARRCDEEALALYLCGGQPAAVTWLGEELGRRDRIEKEDGVAARSAWALARAADAARSMGADDHADALEALVGELSEREGWSAEERAEHTEPWPARLQDPLVNTLAECMGRARLWGDAELEHRFEADLRALRGRGSGSERRPRRWETAPEDDAGTLVTTIRARRPPSLFDTGDASPDEPRGAGAPASRRAAPAPEETGDDAPADDRGALAEPLRHFGRDLCEEVRRGRTGAVIGRSREIDQLVEVLCRRGKGNPVLVGPAGAGKTAIVEGLAHRLVAGDGLPEALRGTRLVAVDLNAMVAGAEWRGQFEKRLAALVEAASHPDVLLFIDELHILVGAGAGRSGQGADQVLKPALAAGDIRVIGATTDDEYHQWIEADAALSRRFQRIAVEPLSAPETVEVLTGLAPGYEEFHGVKIGSAAINAAVSLSDRYLPARHQPDKALDVLDTTCVRVRLALERGGAVPRSRALTVEDVAGTVAEMTGIPVSRMGDGEPARLLGMERELGRRVFGQPEALTAVADALRLARAGLNDPSRPLGSFLFAGPPGVGKSELAKAVAEFLFGDERALVVYDMSEFHDQSTAARLLGSPSGYVDSHRGGQLTEAVSRRPYSVLLFDEIEKAHPVVLDVLLQVLGDARLTDMTGKEVDFSNTVVLLTSNLGAAPVAVRIGFAPGDARDDDWDAAEQARRVERAVSEALRPELVDRLTAVVPFRPLSEDAARRIVVTQLERTAARLAGQGMELSWDEATVDVLLRSGFDSDLGARHVIRAVERTVDVPLARLLLSGERPAPSLRLTGSAGGQVAVSWGRAGARAAR